MSTCHCGRTKANHEPSMHRFTARPQVKETQMPNPATDAGRWDAEAAAIVHRIGGPQLAYHTRRRRERELSLRLLAIEQEAAAGSARREAGLREAAEGVLREFDYWAGEPRPAVDGGTVRLLAFREVQPPMERKLAALRAALTDSRP